jgi:hypothetical protein
MRLGALSYGDDAAREVSRRFLGEYATRAALKSVPVSGRVDGMYSAVAAPAAGLDPSLWRFHAASAAAVDGAAEELVLVPDAGSGRWHRAERQFVAALPFTFETADAAALLTVSEGFALRYAATPWWHITTAMTGGSSSAIGISTDKTNYDTKGDLLGGATGDVLATLTAGIKPGTIGAEVDNLTDLHALLMVEGDIAARFDRITSAFTAGAGYVRMPLIVAAAPATP